MLVIHPRMALFGRKLVATSLLLAALTFGATTPVHAAPPSRIFSLGHYQLHVSLTYQAQASDGSPTNNPVPTPGTGLRPYWNFTSQSESATMSASWTDRMELNKIGLASKRFTIQPVHYPRALGEIHSYEIHTFGTPGFEVAVNDSFTGTYYAPNEEPCDTLQVGPCPVSYAATPFTCTLNARNVAVQEDLRTQWLQAGNLKRELYHGYYDPTRPGAVYIGVDFALEPGHENNNAPPKGGKKSGGGEATGSGGGFLSPTCPPGVNIFEPWSSDSGLLSAFPNEDATTEPKPTSSSRTVYIALDTLIHHGSASKTFTGPATSPTSCCQGTTTYTLKITAHRVH